MYTPQPYLLLPGGELPQVCSEKGVLLIVIIIHPLTEMVRNVESPEKEIRNAENEATCPPPNSVYRERPSHEHPSWQRTGLLEAPEGHLLQGQGQPMGPWKQQSTS